MAEKPANKNHSLQSKKVLFNDCRSLWWYVKKNVINDEKETERSKIKIVAISPSFDGVRFSNVLK